MSVTILIGDCRVHMAAMEPESISAVVTDPPYELGFMGKGWDRSGVAFEVETWRVAFRVLKPGGHLLAFGGPRTEHRMACAIEDAGFEIRDKICWLFGSGFPKSLDVSKAIDKANGKYDVDLSLFGAYVKQQRLAKGLNLGALDALMGTNTAASWWEGRKSGVQLPSLETYQRLKSILDLDNRFDDLIDWAEAERLDRIVSEPANNAVFQPTQRVINSGTPVLDAAEQWDGWGTALKPAYEGIIVARKPFRGTVAANVLAHGTGAINVDGCRIGMNGERWGGNEGNAHSNYSGKVFGSFDAQYAKPSNELGRWPANVVLDEDAAAMLDAQSGERPGKLGMAQHGSGTNSVYGTYQRSEQSFDKSGIADTGGPSRYFYTAKASRSERNKGLDGMPERLVHPDEPNGRAWDIPGSHSTVRANHHPTVKPVDLMQWLVRLVCPPGGTILDPFMGSGSTCIAADREGFECIGIEISPEYVEIARRRIVGDCPMFAEVTA